MYSPKKKNHTPSELASANPRRKPAERGGGLVSTPDTTHDRGALHHFLFPCERLGALNPTHRLSFASKPNVI